MSRDHIGFEEDTQTQKDSLVDSQHSVLSPVHPRLAKNIVAPRLATTASEEEETAKRRRKEEEQRKAMEGINPEVQAVIRAMCAQMAGEINPKIDEIKNAVANVGAARLWF